MWAVQAVLYVKEALLIGVGSEGLLIEAKTVFVKNIET